MAEKFIPYCETLILRSIVQTLMRILYPKLPHKNLDMVKDYCLCFFPMVLASDLMSGGNL